MKSIKPGRGPSMMSGIGAVFAAVFGLIWIGVASSIGAPGIFPLFGLVFIGIAVAQGVYHFSNATRKNRFSVLDVTDEDEEPDPLNEKFGEQQKAPPDCEDQAAAYGYCPYCGDKLPQEDVLYCGRCGKQLPEKN